MDRELKIKVAPAKPELEEMETYFLMSCKVEHMFGTMSMFVWGGRTLVVCRNVVLFDPCSGIIRPKQSNKCIIVVIVLFELGVIPVDKKNNRNINDDSSKLVGFKLKSTSTKARDIVNWVPLTDPPFVRR
jgi:hypothetical protein